MLSRRYKNKVVEDWVPDVRGRCLHGKGKAPLEVTHDYREKRIKS